MSPEEIRLAYRHQGPEESSSALSIVLALSDVLE